MKYRTVLSPSFWTDEYKTKIAIATGIIIRQSAFVYMLINFTSRIFIDNVMSPVTMNNFLTFSQTARLATMQDFFTTKWWF